MVGLKAIARILGGAVKLAAAGPLRRRHDCHHVGRSRRHIHLGQGAAPPSRRTEQVPHEPPPEPVTTATNAPEFQRGDTVTFDDSDGRAITGVIVRINQRTAMTGTADGGTCRVPFHMLRHVHDIRESSASCIGWRQEGLEASLSSAPTKAAVEKLHAEALDDHRAGAEQLFRRAGGQLG